MQDENEDISLERDEDLDDSVVAEESQGESIKKLREKLKTAEDKAKEYLDSWQRSQADFVNIRRRDEEAKQEFLKFANEKLLEELIPVLDSFNIALSAGHNDLEPLYSQLISVLRGRGLEEIEPVGQEFRPEEHEALGIVNTDKKEEDHKVLEVLQKGYRLNGRVIRPAKVRVGEFKN
jgi:molecular chaperone GrpE